MMVPSLHSGTVIEVKNRSGALHRRSAGHSNRHITTVNSQSGGRGFWGQPHQKANRQNTFSQGRRWSEKEVGEVGLKARLTTGEVWVNDAPPHTWNKPTNLSALKQDTRLRTMKSCFTVKHYVSVVQGGGGSL